MPDDIESLLSDIDSFATFNSADEENERDKKKRMRRGDRAVVDPNDGNIEKIFRKRISDISCDAMLDPFRESYVQAFSIHSDLAVQVRDNVLGKDIGESIADLVRKYRYTWERNIGDIEKTYTEFVTTCNIAALQKKARNNQNIYFPNQEITQQKINFLVMKELFIKVREYNSYFRKYWDDLAKGISALNMVQDGKQLFAVCNTLVSDGLQFCEKTGIFSDLLLAILGIPDADQNILEHELPNKIMFFESFDYEYNGILDKKRYIEKPDEFLDIYTDEKETPVFRETEYRERETARQVDTNWNAGKVEVRELNIPFTIKGTCVWNTREPYIIKIDQNRLIKDYTDLENSIYFNSEIPDKIKVAGMVKRSMIHFLRDSSMHIMKKYGEFILKIIPVRIADIASFFRLTEGNQRLFVYHLAPFTMQRILVDWFNHTEIGQCYKLLPDNKVSKYIPVEFIKEKVLLWFEANINVFEMPFDRVSEYNEMKRLVNDRYNEERIINEKKIDKAIAHYHAQTGKVINREMLAKKKAAELYGSMQIIIYNRFIDKTVFK
jgi:hypothetical protein